MLLLSGGFLCSEEMKAQSASSKHIKLEGRERTWEGRFASLFGKGQPKREEGRARSEGYGHVVSAGCFSPSVRAFQRASWLVKNFLTLWAFEACPGPDGKAVLSGLRNSLGTLWDSGT